MRDGPESYEIADAVIAADMVQEIGTRGDAEVTVAIGGTSVDVCRVTYDHRREKIVLHLHPDDVDDALRNLLGRRTSSTDQVAERATGEKDRNMDSVLANAAQIRGWQKPSRCDNSGPNCVEVAPYSGGVAFRTSKAPNGPAFVFDSDEWNTFLEAAKAGQYDNLAG